MKNLSAIPRLSLFAGYTILITLVVCLAGFTGAEAHLRFDQELQDFGSKDDGLYSRRQWQEDPSNAGIYSQKSSKVRDDESSQQRNFADCMNDVEGDVPPFSMIMKRYSEDFDESDGFDSENQNDGYGYDDDEYYHLNYKRDEDGSQKSDKDGVGATSDKDKAKIQMFGTNKAPIENPQKDSKTIEMLDFKEMHPNPDPDHMNAQKPNPYVFQGSAQKKSLNPEPVDTLKISDLKENSALDEKMKSGKEDVARVLASQSDSKVADVKKGAKVMEDKESLSLKDAKVVEESEKKEKEVGLQGKSNLSPKNLLESAKSTEEKEKIERDVKNAKLAESVKIVEGIDKISKSKDGDTAKIAKEDKDNSRFYDRTNSEIISSNGFSQLNNRVNLVSSDYKDNLEHMKRLGMEEDEKNSEELNENDRNVNLNDYWDELRERKDILKESEYPNNYGVVNNGDDNYSEMFRDLGKNSELFGIPVAYEIRNEPRDFYQKRELWKENEKQNPQEPPQQYLTLSNPSKEGGYHFSMPKSDLENTEYHKNFLKSLKRYKNQEEQKMINSVTTDKSSLSDNLSGEPYQKRSKTKRGSMSYGEFGIDNINFGNHHHKSRRHAYTNGDMFARESRVNPDEDRRESQFSQRDKQPYNSRQRRKSQKFEYDKTFDQGTPIGKGFATLNSIKMKKEIKKKFGDMMEGNAVRKYPYSQVSRDYLTKLDQFDNDKKFKRKAPLWKRREQLGDDSRDSDSIGRSKGAPVGYYTNRVKFGQKVGNRNGEEQDNENKLNGVSQFSTTYDKSRNPVEKSWTEAKGQNLKHDPSKRYDEREHSSNPLLLVKKEKNGERFTKAFTDVNSKDSDEELSSDQLAKMLSKDSDYVVLKKKDKNKFQKLSESQGSLEQSSSFVGMDSHKDTLHADPVKSDKAKLVPMQHESGPRSDRGLFIRSYHADEENKKYSSNKLHSSGAKSNLRKTFEKFRDLANLFRDNEQESSDNQRQSSEVKAGGEIVFSEDRMPDPIVISNDATSNLGGFKTKSANSISDISNNFKTLDQNKKTDSKEDNSSRNMLTSEVRNDNTESSWEPALKSAFPEAKSINAVQKDGNEIIVLDFNQNQLKPEASKKFTFGKPSQPIGPSAPSNSIGSLTTGDFSGSSNSFGNIDSAGFFMPSGSANLFQQKNPLVTQGNRQVEVILHEGALPTFLQNDNMATKVGEINKASGDSIPVTKFGITGQNRVFAVPSKTPNEGQITIPIYPFTTFGKNAMEKKPNPLFTNFKSMTKKNSDFMQQNDIANNVNQLMKDFKELSKLYQTHDNRGALGNVYSNEILLPTTSFSQPSSSNKQQFLQNILQNIMSNDKTGEGTADAESNPNENVALDKKAGDSGYQNPDLWSKSNVAYETDPGSKRQGKWTSAAGRKLDYAGFQSNNVEYVPEEVKQDISKLLQSEGFKTTDKDKYQDNLWEELSEASDKIQRLRREGADKGKLKQTIEDALSLRERRQSDTEKKVTSDSKTGDNNKNLESKINTDESKSKLTYGKAAASFKDDKDTDGKCNMQVEPQMKEGDNKENHESKRSVTKSDLEEGHLTDSSPKSKSVDSKDTVTKKRKRRQGERRKRSLNVKNKVSTADIKNEILKNLAEDNYQSVYSSGIRRKLLSIQDDEDADNYINQKGNDEQLVTDETRLQPLNDPTNNGIDPTILTLFDTKTGENENSRARRSLSAFHSDYKREIDLDESMPNDFQSFLVTSLGGFGSQKREVVKKDEALWEGRESSPDNLNQIVDSSQGSALEKRDVSKSEKHRRESFRGKNNYFTDESGKEISRLESGSSHTRKKARSQDSSKPSKFEEDKTPSHTRIQLANASSKEKKSSKPIMDESENTSTEMENLPKEKEFLDKNKVRVNKAQKMYSLRDPKFASSKPTHLEGENPNTDRHQKVYFDTHPSHRRIKKKYAQENSVKPVKGFMAVDQKAMQSLLKKYFDDQSSYGITTQKIPVGSHLPQVETVYNPAQGANKAQLEKQKMSSLKGNNKISGNSKTGFKSNQLDSFDPEAVRSYFLDKPERTKSAKENAKSYVDSLDWKPLTGNTRLGLSSDNEMQTDIKIPKLKSFSTDFGSPSTSTAEGYPSKAFDTSNQMMWPQQGLNYMSQSPSSRTYTNNALYDALKLKQEMQPYGYMKGSSLAKTWPKSTSGIEELYSKPNDKTPSNLYDHTLGRLAWNHDILFNKNPILRKYKIKDTYGGMSKEKFFNNILKLKSSVTEKQLRSVPQQFYVFDNAKDFDYMDALGDDYLDNDDPGKQDSQIDAVTSPELFKKSNKMFAYNPLHMKNSELDRTTSEEELDEDYDENNEEDEDYSIMTKPNLIESSSMNLREREGPQGSMGLQDSSSIYSQPVSYKGNAYENTQYTNPKSEELLDGNAKYTDTRNYLNPYDGPSSVIRKINENSNNFGENLMKSLNRYNYDELWAEMRNRDMSKIYGDGYESNKNSKMDKRKINWTTKLKRNPHSKITNRLIYASKSEAFNPKDLNIGSNQGTQNEIGRSAYYRLPKRNPMNAELRGAENEFEYESEGNGKHFTGNLLNGGKDNDHDSAKWENSKEVSGDSKEDGGTNKRNSEDSENVDDVKENLEDDGETIADDNILENVIGKYIMRKSVKAGALSRFDRRDEKKLSEDPIRHNLKKRSLEDILSEEPYPRMKITKKRLSSGHLTESNFRKYHKKNPNKRHLKDLDKFADSDVISNEMTEEDEPGDVSEENEEQNPDSKQVTLSSDENEIKRSALDIFKKITNKDKDSKQFVDINIRTTGFEPIVSSNDDNIQNLVKELNHDGLVSSLKKSNELNSKLHSESKDVTAEDKVEKLADMTSKDLSSGDGPWRIELKEKDSKSSLVPGRNSEKKFKSTISMKDRLTPDKPKQDLQKYITFNKNVKAAKINSGSEEAINSGKLQVDDSFWAEDKEDASQSERNIRKRSLKYSSDQLQDSFEDTLGSEATDISKTKNSVSQEETKKALRDTSNLPEYLKAQAPQNIQNSGFVNAEAQFRHSGEKRKFFPNNGPNDGKSLFPIPNDANIIGDNMHLNEETSKYLGQQIVDAILAQATTDPRFKKFIAPGLSVQAPHIRRQTEDDGKSLHPKDYSDQVQTLMQTVMSDLEKLAEKHVKKRMCNQIDNQSKQFLHFLLNVPMEKFTQTEQIKDQTRSIPHSYMSAGSVSNQNPSNPAQVYVQETPMTVSNQPKKFSQFYQFDEIDANSQSDDEKPAVSRKDAIFLMRKKCLLAQLLKNYQYLKDEDLGEQYSEKVRTLAKELETTEKELAAIDPSLCGCSKKKKPPCPPPCAFPSNPCPQPPPPPPPPPPRCPCPPPPPPRCPCPPPPCPANKDLGLQRLDVEQKKPPVNESQECTTEKTTKTTKEPADIFQFDPMGPLNTTHDEISTISPKFQCILGFETVTSQNGKDNKTANTSMTLCKLPLIMKKINNDTNTTTNNNTSTNTCPNTCTNTSTNTSQTDNNQQQSNDNQTVCNDNQRQSNDNQTVCNDNQRQSNDNQTVCNDNQRQSNDNQTVCNDNQRQSNDNQTVCNDNQRQSNDNQTVCNDNQRQSNDNQTDTNSSSPDSLRFYCWQIYPPINKTVPAQGNQLEDSAGANLPFNCSGPSAKSINETKETPASTLGWSSVAKHELQLERVSINNTSREDLLANIKNSRNILNMYNNDQVPYIYQLRHPKYPEDGSFRRNFYDKNVIPTDKDDDSASQKIRSQNLSGKNRRFSRNTKNKRLSLRSFRQERSMGEDVDGEQKRSRDRRGWWRPKSQKQSQRTYLAQNGNEDDEEDPGMEYLVWSSMPAVRRRLNNIESNIDLDKISWPGLRRRNWPEEGEEQRGQPGSE